MIGVSLKFEVDMTLFSPKEVKKEDDILKIKESVGEMPQDICDVIYDAFKANENDAVSVELMAIKYLEPQDMVM